MCARMKLIVFVPFQSSADLSLNFVPIFSLVRPSIAKCSYRYNTHNTEDLMIIKEVLLQGNHNKKN